MNKQEYTIRQCREFISEQLTGLYPEEEIKSLTVIVLKHLTGLPLSSLLADREKPVSNSIWVKINEICDHLKVFMPIQYILGETEFMGLRIKTPPNVLIPRPETEELTDLVISENPEPGLSVLDIGTGSGAIAITLALRMNSADVNAIDTGSDIIETAETNSRLNGARVRFMKDDIFKPSNNHLIYDIIVSNPPYVREMEKEQMSPNVLNYEPHGALFVPDNDPLKFYRAIFIFAQRRLAPGGKIYFEINEALGSEMYDLAEQSGYDSIRILEDINGRERILAAIKND